MYVEKERGRWPWVSMGVGAQMSMEFGSAGVYYWGVLVSMGQVMDVRERGRSGPQSVSNVCLV